MLLLVTTQRSYLLNHIPIYQLRSSIPYVPNNIDIAHSLLHNIDIIWHMSNRECAILILFGTGATESVQY
jgi:hypothetical protein